jgi:Protein of unknown function DUF262
MRDNQTQDISNSSEATAFSPESVDEEDVTSGGVNLDPWDPTKIRITTKSFSLRDVVDQIAEKDIDLAPDYQRDFVWKDKQRTRLIESILLGIPLPAFYFNQDSKGTYQVVDGVQRLSTISSFMRGDHRLDRRDLEYLETLHGLTYAQLDQAALRRFRSTQIVVHVIEPQTPDEVKYDIFGRVNTLGSPLSAQEIRHAMSGIKSRAFLKELTELPEFDIATERQFWRKSPDAGNRSVRDSGRMTNRELVLRFCAFRKYSEIEYRKFKSLDAFLVEFTKRLDGRSKTSAALTDKELKKLKNDFSKAMKNAFHVLGKGAFRRWPPEQQRRGPINRAVFEAQSIALCDYPLEQLLEKKEAISSAFRFAFTDDLYARSVTVGTGDPNAVSRRLSETRKKLAKALK